MVRKIMLLTIIVILLFAGGVLGTAGMEEVFSTGDPVGDSDGPGGYTYPQHHSFPPELSQMLDLTGFRVMNIADRAVRFEFEFAQNPDLHKPWGGAGFNFHRIDLYIVMGDTGATSTFRPGAQVEFAQPWQINLRLRDWRGSYILHWEQHNPNDPKAGVWQDQVEGFNVFVEGNTVVAEINQTLIGAANNSWKYYVLVGLQDPYGPDQYRQINLLPGPWTGGGGCDSDFNPNVYDILADTTESQYRQLSWEVGHLAVLEPVGPRTTTELIWQVVKVVGIVLLALGLAILVWVMVQKK